MSAEHFITFKYDEKGRGVVELHNNSLIETFVEARTGSINAKGILVNAIRPGIWTIRKPSKDTTEIAMEWQKDFGWKTRLWTPEGKWSRYLIHPDGGRNRGNGTKGCIGIQGNGIDLRYDIDVILKMQEQVKVYINQEVLDG